MSDDDAPGRNAYVDYVRALGLATLALVGVSYVAIYVANVTRDDAWRTCGRAIFITMSFALPAATVPFRAVASRGSRFVIDLAVAVGIVQAALVWLIYAIDDPPADVVAAAQGAHIIGCAFVGWAVSSLSDRSHRLHAGLLIVVACVGLSFAGGAGRWVGMAISRGLVWTAVGVVALRMRRRWRAVDRPHVATPSRMNLLVAGSIVAMVMSLDALLERAWPERAWAFAIVSFSGIAVVAFGALRSRQTRGAPFFAAALWLSMAIAPTLVLSLFAALAPSTVVGWSFELRQTMVLATAVCLALVGCALSLGLRAVAYGVDDGRLEADARRGCRLQGIGAAANVLACCVSDIEPTSAAIVLSGVGTLCTVWGFIAIALIAHDLKARR